MANSGFRPPRPPRELAKNAQNDAQIEEETTELTNENLDSGAVFPVENDENNAFFENQTEEAQFEEETKTEPPVPPRPPIPPKRFRTKSAVKAEVKEEVLPEANYSENFEEFQQPDVGQQTNEEQIDLEQQNQWSTIPTEEEIKKAEEEILEQSSKAEEKKLKKQHSNFWNWAGAAVFFVAFGICVVLLIF